MNKTQWPHTLHISLNQEKQDNPVSQTECLVLSITVIFQILDVPVSKPDVPVSTG
jgi:hypothetical protein